MALSEEIAETTVAVRASILAKLAKISELWTDRAFDVFCEITPYVGNIVEDEALRDALKSKLNASDKLSQAEIITFGLQKLNKLIPIILKTHRADVYGILAVLAEKTPEEIAAQNIIVTLTQIRDAIKDKELVDFFKSCVGPAPSE